ncbi:hypothetical protein P1X16_19575 [Hymenobacter sp. YC55]|nr:hypothetical protein [Hymenobacter sp. YC55]
MKAPARHPDGAAKISNLKKRWKGDSSSGYNTCQTLLSGMANDAVFYFIYCLLNGRYVLTSSKEKVESSIILHYCNLAKIQATLYFISTYVYTAFVESVSTERIMHPGFLSFIASTSYLGTRRNSPFGATSICIKHPSLSMLSESMLRLALSLLVLTISLLTV